MGPQFYDNLVKRVDYLYKVIGCINGDCSDFNEIESVVMNGRNIEIQTSKDLFAADVDYLFRVEDIAARNTLPGGFQNKIRHSIVFVENTTGDPGNPQPNAYVYNIQDDSWTPLVSIPGGNNQTRLVSGNLFWDSGLTFTTTPNLSYLISGALYELVASQSVTLDAADPTNPRIDVIVLDKNGVLGKVTGVATPNPQRPVVDEALLLPVTFVTVAANATAPGQVKNILLYEQGIQTPDEANYSVNGVPRIIPVVDIGGDNHIHFDNAQNGDHIDLVFTPITLADFNIVLFSLRNIIPQPPADFDLTFAFMIGVDTIHTVDVFQYIDRNITDEQHLALSFQELGLDVYDPAQAIDTLRIVVKNSSGVPTQLFLDSIILQENGIQGPDPSITQHNQLQGIQGGVPGEHYHFSQQEWLDLKELIYQPPTLSLTPATIGSELEVGDNLVITNSLITITIGNEANVLNNQIILSGTTTDGTITPIPNNFLINKTVQGTARGWTTLATGSIQRDDNNITISDTVRALFEYAVAYFAFPQSEGDIIDPGDITDQDLIDIMNGTYSYIGTAPIIKRSLKSDKNFGNVTLTPVAGGLSTIVVIHPVSYGTAVLASKFSPDSPFNPVTIRDFTYTNNGLTTAYRLVAGTSDQIGAEYDANIT